MADTPTAGLPELKVFAWAYAEERFGRHVVRLATEAVDGAKPLVLKQAATAAIAAERERCAKLVESGTYKQRWISAGINSEPIKPCALAAAIRALGEKT